MQETLNNVENPVEVIKITPVNETKYLVEKISALNLTRTIINEKITNAALKCAGSCKISISELNLINNIDESLKILEKEIRLAGYGYIRCPGLSDSIIVSWDGSNLIEPVEKEYKEDSH